jgi:TPR repeat protein
MLNGESRNEPAEDTFQKGIKVYQSGDMASALKLFAAAARAGNSKAAVQVGWQYEYGKGVSQNFAEAAKWYREGAEHGNSRGQKNLGALYEAGRGVTEDWIVAAKWYQQSAAQGNAEGQAALARAYMFGMGVPQSRKDAIYWDQKAAAQGDEESAYFVRWLSHPTNNIGFRNPDERNIVIGYRMVDMIVHNEPAGTVFRNSSERNEYLIRVARRLDNDQAYSRWWRARAEYTQCEAARRSGCRNPGSEPR